MRFTTDNVEALYNHCRDAKHWAERRDNEKVIRHVCHALTTLGFEHKSDVAPKDTREQDRHIMEYREFWNRNSRPYYLWLNYQGESRDWYVNAEIKANRSKMSISIRPLTIHLLDVALAAGKVYDK